MSTITIIDLLGEHICIDGSTLQDAEKFAIDELGLISEIVEIEEMEDLVYKILFTKLGMLNIDMHFLEEDSIYHDIWVNRNDEEKLRETLLSFEIKKIELAIALGADVDQCNLIHTYMYSTADKEIEFGKVINMTTDINALDGDGLSPLHVACRMSEHDCIDVLIERGADIELKDGQFGRTPLFYCETVLSAIKMMEAGANPNHKDTIQMTPLMHAAWGTDPTTETLASFGAKITSKDRKGSDALYYAVSHHNDNAVAFLIESGVNINEKYKRGKTALHIASYNGYHRIVEMLLEAGADPKIKNSNGATSLHYAIKGGRAAIADTLMKSDPSLSMYDPLNNGTILYL